MNLMQNKYIDALQLQSNSYVEFKEGLSLENVGHSNVSVHVRTSKRILHIFILNVRYI